MAQPLWALPAPGVPDIMGHCVTELLFSGAVCRPALHLFQPLADGDTTHGCSRTCHATDTACPPPSVGLGRAGATVSLARGGACHGGVCHLEAELD
ncbi:TIGR00366 family protein [Paraburkholderia sediminicola]